MNIYLITEPITLDKISVPIADMEIFSVSLQSFEASVFVEDLTGGLIEDVIRAEIINPGFRAEILDNPIVILQEIPESMNVIFNFSQGDLIDGWLTRTHNFNQIPVDVSIADNLNQEVLVRAEFPNPNTVELDFSRATITGVWKILIEK